MGGSKGDKSSGNKDVATYCFVQQRDSSCHIMPFLNLKLLNEMRARAKAKGRGNLDLNQDAMWHTRREWLPETFEWTRTWSQALNTLSQNGPFADWQNDRLENGIIMGNMYLENGKHYYKTINPLRKYTRMMLTPFTFTGTNGLNEKDKNAIAEHAYKTLPLFVDHDGQIIMYDKSNDKYETIKPAGQCKQDDYNQYDIPPDTNLILFNQVTQQFNFFKLSEAQCAYFGLNPKLMNPVIQWSEKNGILGYKGAYAYQYTPPQANEHVYFMSSLFSFIMFGMGVDRNNNDIMSLDSTIPENQKLQDAYIQFRKETESAPHNPWALDTFDKNNLIEYHITNLVKSDPELMAKMEKTIDVLFPTWKYYNNLENLYDSPDPNNRTCLKDKMHYLPSREQMLAYKFAQVARMIWSASTSKEAYAALLEIQGPMEKLLNLPTSPNAGKMLRNANKKKDGVSFLDVWQEIRKRLAQNENIPKDLASFSSHGIVMSFSDDLNERQYQAGVESPDIMNKLGFCVIDSYYGERFKPFYRSTLSKNHTPQIPSIEGKLERMQRVGADELSTPEEKAEYIKKFSLSEDDKHKIATLADINLKIQGTKTRYEDKRAHNYFMLSPRGIAQRLFSKKKERENQMNNLTQRCENLTKIIRSQGVTPDKGAQMMMDELFKVYQTLLEEHSDRKTKAKSRLETILEDRMQEVADAFDNVKLPEPVKQALAENKKSKPKLGP